MSDSSNDPGGAPWQTLASLLRSDPRDLGCTACRVDIAVYAELVADGEDAATRHPGVAAHVRACGDCRDDLDGLVIAVSSAAR